MEIIKIIAVVASLVAAAWGLYMLMKLSDKAMEDISNEAPYKIERPMSAEQLAISIAHKSAKRKYTKRSKYWGSPQHKAKLKKARKAKARKSRKSESK